MKQKMKQSRTFLMGMVTTLLLISLSVSAFAAYNQSLTVTYDDIKLNINGMQITPKDVTGRVVEPFTYQGTTYLPVRAVGEAVGYTVSWDQTTKTVFMTMAGGTTGGNQGGNQGGNTQTPAVNLVDTFGDPYSYYDNWEYGIYPSNGGDSITMGGTGYKNALRLNSLNRNTNYAMYNLGGKYTSLGGIVGSEDGNNGNKTATLSIFGDGTLLKSIDVSDGALPVNFSVDVSGVSQLKFELGPCYGGPDVGMADLKLS